MATCPDLGQWRQLALTVDNLTEKVQYVLCTLLFIALLLYTVSIFTCVCFCTCHYFEYVCMYVVCIYLLHAKFCMYVCMYSMYVVLAFVNCTVCMYVYTKKTILCSRPIVYVCIYACPYEYTLYVCMCATYCRCT